MKYLTLVALAACTFATGCMSYTERTVVQKPVPAQSTVYTTTPPRQRRRRRRLFP